MRCLIFLIKLIHEKENQPNKKIISMDIGRKNFRKYFTAKNSPSAIQLFVLI